MKVAIKFWKIKNKIEDNFYAFGYWVKSIFMKKEVAVVSTSVCKYSSIIVTEITYINKSNEGVA